MGEDVHPFPDLDETCCPHMHSLFLFSKVPKGTMTMERELARVQFLMHDPVTPLLRVVNSINTVLVNEAKAAIGARTPQNELQ